METIIKDSEMKIKWKEKVGCFTKMASFMKEADSILNVMEKELK